MLFMSFMNNGIAVSEHTIKNISIPGKEPDLVSGIIEAIKIGLQSIHNHTYAIISYLIIEAICLIGIARRSWAKYRSEIENWINKLKIILQKKSKTPFEG